MKICLVSPGHLGSNPRLVKEADALLEAGHEVHVIYGDSHAPARVRDRAILASSKWSHEVVGLLERKPLAMLARVVGKLSRRLFGMGWRSARLAESGYHPMALLLARRARRYKADLYIGHCLAALPAVVKAARYHGAKAGFDAEDFHSGELMDEGEGAVMNAMASLVEGRYLPRLSHRTAAAPLIAEAYEERYGLKFTTLLNVFPLAEAVKSDARFPAREGLVSFYWFSQTIGPGRGLEAFLDVAMATGVPLRMDLRGEVKEDYARALSDKIRGSMVEVAFLPPDEPANMVPCAAGYSAGLSLEQGEPLNRNLCLTNKAFTYLLAGTPVILSPTEAQSRLADELGEAGFVIDFSDVESASRRLREWIKNPMLRSTAAEEAQRLGRLRYNWDIEKKEFLQLVSSLEH